MQRVKTLIKKYPGMLSMLGMCFYDYCVLPCNAIIWGIAMIVIPVFMCKECIGLDKSMDDAIVNITREQFADYNISFAYFGTGVGLYIFYSLLRINEIVWMSFSGSSAWIILIAGMYSYEIYKRYIRKWTKDRIMKILCCVLIVCMTSVGFVYIIWSISHPTHMEANVIKVEDEYGRYGKESSITLMLDNGRTEWYRGDGNMGKKIRAGVPLVRCEHQCAFGVHIRDIHFDKGENCRCSYCHQDE